jgi:glycosyltransferase involved in cell wall biosynthesis
MTGRVTIEGKHLSLDGEIFRVRGATYGTFLPRPDGEPYPHRSQVKADFVAMAEAGLNVVRTYTVPPPDILEVAEEVGIRFIVGLHYDDWRAEPRVARGSHRRVLDRGRRAVERTMGLCAGNPWVLAVSVGNEVPGDIVRLYGIEGVQDVLEELAQEMHAADPSMLVTYSNYPTTEYLRLHGLDFLSFNVFLEEPPAFRAYLERLQTISSGLPLVITELGLAAQVHGQAAQAASLEWQLRATDEVGCAGACVFAWTDEWGVAGHAVDGWGFGLTEADRSPKQALDVVRGWTASALPDLRSSWPTISVIVCTYNEEARIGGCLESLLRIDYPQLEVIVCDDGSSDATTAVCRKFPFRVLQLPHRGLGAARNAGLTAASGEIVAFLDADAWCPPEWPYHLALSLEGDVVAGTGGPNLPAPDTGLVERAVAASPGGPAEVLVSDNRAEHVPGCNMAFKRDRLLAVGAFDPVFTTAGDDVDLCWRLLDEGNRIAFSHAAQVFHHRRDTVRGYLKQQRGYGRGERLLMKRHSHRFNRFGQARWGGVIYGGTGFLARLLRPLIYHGVMGLAAFQGRVPGRSGTVMAWVGAVLPLTFLASLIALPFAFFEPRVLPLLASLLMVPVAYGAAIALSYRPPSAEPHPLAIRSLVGFLHAAQPIARAWGRMTGSGGTPKPMSPRSWLGDRASWLVDLEHSLAASGCRVRKARPTDRFDLRIGAGPLLAGRLTTAVAWGWLPRHRFSIRPRPIVVGATVVGAALLSTDGWYGSAILGVLAAALGIEATRLRRRVRRSVRLTTQGAQP